VRAEDLPDPTRRVELEFSYNQAEFVATLRWLWLRRLDTPVMAAIGVTCVVIGAELARKFAVAGAVLLVIGVVYVIMGIMAMMILPILRWRKRPELRVPRYYAFTDAGVEVRTDSIEIESKWSRFTSTRESSRCYLLQIEKSRLYVYLPKRTFASRSDELAFRGMAKRHTDAHLKVRRSPVRELSTG
jgi:hypothetical protein